MEEQKILNHADGPGAACVNGMSSLKTRIDVEGEKLCYWQAKKINECGLTHFYCYFSYTILEITEICILF